jgi:hypothetical protein
MTIIVTIAMTLVDVTPVPVTMHAVLSLPSIVLGSTMACRVFRQLRIGMINDFDTITTASENPASVHFTRWSSLAVVSGNEPRGVEKSRRGPINIQITQKTESSDLTESIGLPKAVIKDTV